MVKYQIEEEISFEIKDANGFERLICWDAKEFGGWEATFSFVRKNIYFDDNNLSLLNNGCSLSLVFNSNLETPGKNKWLFKSSTNVEMVRNEISLEFDNTITSSKALKKFIDQLRETNININQIDLKPIILLKQTRHKRGIFFKKNKIYISIDRVDFYNPADTKTLIDTKYFCEFEAKDLDKILEQGLCDYVQLMKHLSGGFIAAESKQTYGYACAKFGIWQLEKIFCNKEKWANTYLKIQDKLTWKKCTKVDLFEAEKVRVYATLQFYKDHSYYKFYAYANELKRNVENQLLINSHKKSEFELTPIFVVYTNIVKKMVFCDVIDSAGKIVSVSRDKYAELLSNVDENIREGAFNSIYTEYEKEKCNIERCYMQIISTMKNSFFDENIMQKNYRENFIEQIINQTHQYIPFFQDYIKLRCNYSGIKNCKIFDLQFPILASKKFDVSYMSAIKILQEAFDIFDKDIRVDIENILVNGYVDILCTDRKKNGNYSLFFDNTFSGYASIKYKSDYLSIIALAHEVGHLLGNMYCRDYSKLCDLIKELQASICESMIMKYFRHILTPAEFVETYLEKYRANYFRQMMLFEFEFTAYNKPVKKEDELQMIYSNLLERYYSNLIIIPEKAKFEYLKVPHLFCNPQIIGTYPICFLLGEYIAEKIYEGSFDFKKFLKLSPNNDVVFVLKQCGIDIFDNKIFNNFFGKYKKLIDDYKKLLENR